MCSQSSTSHPAKLVALQEEIKPAEYLLENPICLIGRSDICHINIPDRTLSRLQAVIVQYEAGCYILHDSNSANGTYVNGQRLWAPHPLTDQDGIGFATAKPLMRFEVTKQKTSTDEVEAVII